MPIPDDACDFPNSTVHVERPTAVLFESEGVQRWVPKACIHDDSEVFKDGHKGTMLVKLDFAEKKGWI